jgi:hypothetical protein
MWPLNRVARFSLTQYMCQNGDKYTKLPITYQMTTVKYSKWTSNIPTFSILCKALQNLPKLRFLVWKYTVWQPCPVNEHTFSIYNIASISNGGILFSPTAVQSAAHIWCPFPADQADNQNIDFCKDYESRKSTVFGAVLLNISGRQYFMAILSTDKVMCINFDKNGLRSI